MNIEVITVSTSSRECGGQLDTPYTFHYSFTIRAQFTKRSARGNTRDRHDSRETAVTRCWAFTDICDHWWRSIYSCCY